MVSVIEEEVLIDGDEGLEPEEVDATVSEGNLENSTEEAESTEESEVTEESAETGEDDDIQITLEGEAIESENTEETPLIKRFRDRDRAQQKQIKEANAKLAQFEQDTPEARELGKEPQPEDFAYDNDKYKPALLAWNEKRIKVDADKTIVQEENAKFQRQHEDKWNEYNESTKTFKRKDFKDVESEVANTLSPTQQNIIVHHAKNAPLVIYAIGKNPKVSESLSKIADPVKFAVEVTRLESNLKTNEKRPTSKPEAKVKGTTAPLSEKGLEKQRDKLADEAVKSGDMRKLSAFNAKHKKTK